VTGPGVARAVPASVLLDFAQALDEAHQEIRTLKAEKAELEEHVRQLQAVAERAHT
jgi:cell division protein FtsB